MSKPDNGGRGSWDRWAELFYREIQEISTGVKVLGKQLGDVRASIDAANPHHVPHDGVRRHLEIVISKLNGEGAGPSTPEPKEEALHPEQKEAALQELKRIVELIQPVIQDLE